MMRFVIVAAIKDVRRRMTDPAALMIWIGIPVVLGTLLTLVLGRDTATPRAKVWLVDEDGSVASRLLARAAGGGSSPFGLEVVALDEARRRIDRGEGTAIVVLPAGLQAAILDDTAARIVLVENPAQRILPNIVEEALTILAEATFYGQRLLGEPLRTVAGTLPDGPPSDAGVSAISVAIAERIRGLRGALLPPVLSLEVTV